MKHHATRVCRCLTCGQQATTFGSLTEADYYFSVLLPRKKAGQIRGIKVHPEWTVAGVRIIADFSYREPYGLDGYRTVVIDVKGVSAPLTAAYKRNEKMLASIGVEVWVVRWSVKTRKGK